MEAPNSEQLRLYGQDRGAEFGETDAFDMQSIFRAMIAQELRAGRLDRAGRKRIVRYAAQLGLSAVEAGEMISECRERALESSDADERRFALRVPTAPDPATDRPAVQAWLAGVVLAVDLILLVWLLMR